MKKTHRKFEGFELDLIDKYNNVASGTECTGLMQTPPVNEAEAQSYGDIYIVPEQINDFSRVKKVKVKHTKSAPDE